jgi:hypothetical protein
VTRFKLSFLNLAAACALLAGTTPAVAQSAISVDDLEAYTERVPTGYLNWGAGFAEVTVEAPYETERYGGSHAKIRAIEKAEELAEEALFRLVRGINLTGSTRLAGDEAFEAALRQVIKKQSGMNDQKTANVTMTALFRLPLHGRKALSGTLLPLLAEGDTAGALAGTGGGEYTSIVLDATGTTLQAALFPRLLDESGQVLFGPADLDEKAMAKGSPATYVVRGQAEDKDLRLPKSLAKTMGDNPLVLKVRKVGGEFFADVVLRPEQVETLQAAQPGDLLSEGRLFIIQTTSVDVSKR